MLVRYTLSNRIGEPRTVRVPNFDYMFVDVAAERIAHALRKDICLLYNASASLADYLPLFLSTLHLTLLNATTALTP